MLKIYIYKEHPDAVMPKIAYNGTSAAFDLTTTETVVIKPGESKMVQNGLRIVIDEKDPYYMQVFPRSSAGIENELVAHPGVIDAGYTGNMGIFFHNFGKKPYIAYKGSRMAQIVIHRKPEFEFVELSKDEFLELESRQSRGSKGLGSSGM